MHRRLLRTWRTPVLAFAAAVAATGAGSFAVASGNERLRVTAVSGTPQAAHAYVDPHAPRYETIFPQKLVAAASPGVDKVRFRCITPGCEFPLSDQPGSVARVDPRTFDVDTVKGNAQIALTISTVTPQTVIVLAQAASGRGEAARFILDAR